MVHDHDPVRARTLFHVVGNEDDRNAFLFIELRHGFDHILTSCRIEHGRGFIEDNAFGPHGYDARDGDSLLLSSGKLVRGLQAVGGHAELIERFIHTP